MKYTIIEDCSPYYIRFTHDNIEDLVNTARNHLPNLKHFPNWCHFNLGEWYPDRAKDLLPKIPVFEDLDLRTDRLSYFVSGPGLYYRAHKDGWPGERFSINYPILVQNDHCVTSWYNDDDLAHYPIDRLPTKVSRECIGFNKSKHTPSKTMIAKLNEGILFNTDIFHDWDNSRSQEHRIILTLRHRQPENFYFEDARKALFGY